jgi:hypothetical protein
MTGRAKGEVPGITRLEEGNQPRVEENITIKIKPVTNSGSEIATREITLTV